MRLVEGLVLLGVAIPASGQYGGPAILSRGQAPSAMATPTVDFQPYLGLFGTYSTGLADVSVNDQGGLADSSAYGATLSWGVSGAHSWRRTRVGLTYHGALNHYHQQTGFDSIDQEFALGLIHQVSRHATFTWNSLAGITTRDNTLRTLNSAVPFDPNTTYAPTTDFFDNRTVFYSTQASLTFQKSARLSFDLGGDGFITRRESEALYGVIGAIAHGDVQYRVSRRNTVGLVYVYGHYDFTKIFGGTDYQGLAVAFSTQLTRLTEFSAFAGAYRVESKFTEQVPIDPDLAALLGISSATRVSYGTNYTPNLSGRLSRTFSRGVAYIFGGHTITPGNGLFLTSFASEVGAGYTYTGLRKWTFNAGAGYEQARSVGHIIGAYSTLSGSVAVSRKFTRVLSGVVDYSVRNYKSPDYAAYNRPIHSVAIGFAFAPGEIPLRVW